MTAPTRPLGAADPYNYTGYTTLYDALEHVPDLQPGPMAVTTYAQMRRDPRLAAVLAGYTLQIRRASWQVEPGGCRPEVVQQVADDMGLPVAGADAPGAARTRGVSWNDHLRSALLCLPFGHMCFETLAEIVDGRARLVALAERMPYTLEQIHSDPKTGALLGVTQDKPRKNDRPQIPADRLAFYTHNREASWFGSSLLRASYAPWFLKQTLLRVHATSARRFGMGVPTVEWAAGTNPTPQQMTEAFKVAASARVGEEAGASLPPGARLVLNGLTGSVPDVLGYIRYLDQQMVTSALMPHLELGSSETGSRAVASTFLDSWTLALGAIAEEIADVATRQIAARIVAWNWGEAEQVPRVVVSGVGTQREVTAESLAALLDAGALSADPALEAWVRREYRLPEREQAEAGSVPTGRIFESDVAQGNITKNERRAMFNLPPLEGGDVLPDTGPKPASPPPTQPVAASSSRRRPQTAGQLALPIAASAEDDARRVQAEYETALAAALAAWPAVAAPMIAELAAEAEVHVSADDIAGLATLGVGAAVVDGIAAALTNQMTALAGMAAAQVVAEAAAQGVDVPPAEPDEQRIGQVAAVTAALIAAGYATAAVRRAMLAPVDVAATVTAALVDMSTSGRGMVADHIGAALSQAQGQGRLAAYTAAPATEWLAIEANDKAACAACRKADGTRFPTLAAALRDYPNGIQNASCAGGARCRGMLLPVWSQP